MIRYGFRSTCSGALGPMETLTRPAYIHIPLVFPPHGRSLQLNLQRRRGEAETLFSCTAARIWTIRQLCQCTCSYTTSCCATPLMTYLYPTAKESDVLPSFRKRYTSARKLAFRTPTAYELNQIAGRSSREGGILCIDVRFTGPQPIEGPADLLCNLLQASFVAAQAVQLGRGRKRKNRGGISAPQPPSFASSTNDGSRTGEARDGLGARCGAVPKEMPSAHDVFPFRKKKGSLFGPFAACSASAYPSRKVQPFFYPWLQP